MKSSISIKDDGFQPVSITLTAESARELLELYAILTMPVKDAFLPIGFEPSQDVVMNSDVAVDLQYKLDSYSETEEYMATTWVKGGRKPTKSKKG